MRKNFFNRAEEGYFKQERSGANALAMGGTCGVLLPIRTCALNVFRVIKGALI